MGIRFGSINTGLPPDIVKQIIQSERRPIMALEDQKGKLEERGKLVSEIQGLVREIESSVREIDSMRKFRLLKADVGREDLMRVDIDSQVAQPGEYEIKIELLAQKSSAISNGFPDPDETDVGVGYFSYELPESEQHPDGLYKEVWIDSDDNTLNGLAKKINDERALGLQAIVVNDGTFTENPYRLIITKVKSGDYQRVEWPSFYFTNGDQDFYVDQEREAHDAIIHVDGFRVEVPENRTSALIPGVSMELLNADENDEFTLSIKEDIPAIADKIQALVDKINKALKFVIDQNTLDAESDTSRTLGGDSTLQTLESRLRRIMLDPILTEFGVKRLNSAGIELQRDGLLKFNKEKFQVEIGKDFERVAQLFVGWYDPEEEFYRNGFAQTLENAVVGFTRPGNGVLETRAQGVKSRIKEINRNIDNKERALALREQSLARRFARLETTMNELKSQSAGLAALGGGGGGLLTQLGPAQKMNRP